MSYDNDAPGSDGDLRPSWPASADDYEVLLVDRPAPLINRITLNRPDKRNALNNKLRAELLHALREGDRDPDVHVQIVRGAGPSFSAGYDLGGGNEGLLLPRTGAVGQNFNAQERTVTNIVQRVPAPPFSSVVPDDFLVQRVLSSLI